MLNGKIMESDVCRRFWRMGFQWIGICWIWTDSTLLATEGRKAQKIANLLNLTMFWGYWFTKFEQKGDIYLKRILKIPESSWKIRTAVLCPFCVAQIIQIMSETISQWLSTGIQSAKLLIFEFHFRNGDGARVCSTYILHLYIECYSIAWADFMRIHGMGQLGWSTLMINVWENHPRTSRTIWRYLNYGGLCDGIQIVKLGTKNNYYSFSWFPAVKRT